MKTLEKSVNEIINQNEPLNDTYENYKTVLEKFNKMVDDGLIKKRETQIGCFNPELYILESNFK